MEEQNKTKEQGGMTESSLRQPRTDAGDGELREANLGPEDVPVDELGVEHPPEHAVAGVVGRRRTPSRCVHLILKTHIDY